MISVGAATRVINNELGRWIQGASVNNRALSIRDNLEANVLFLTDGTTPLLFAGCDLAAVPSESAAVARSAIAAATSLPPEAIIIAGTHTHNGPSIIPTHPRKPVDMEYLARLVGWLTEAAVEAVGNARPARLATALGAAQVGYNRRCCWADGTHTMHDRIDRAAFTGLEGPDDPSQFALFARDMDGKLIAVLHNNTSHPTCFYGAEFYSSDFPGAARTHLRHQLGTALPVLFFNGAFGDISITDQTAPRNTRRESAEQMMNRAGHLLAGETLALLHTAKFSEDVALAHTHMELPVAVRLPDAEALRQADALIEKARTDASVGLWDLMFACGTRRLQDEFGSHPEEKLRLHAIRIGNAAVATVPLELFCQFGLDIKRRSPFSPTALFGIADGYSGYCPTLYGILGGGYSGQAIHWARLAADAGYRVVDACCKLLHDCR